MSQKYTRRNKLSLFLVANLHFDACCRPWTRLGPPLAAFRIRYVFPPMQLMTSCLPVIGPATAMQVTYSMHALKVSKVTHQGVTGVRTFALPGHLPHRLRLRFKAWDLDLEDTSECKRRRRVTRAKRSSSSNNERCCVQKMSKTNLEVKLLAFVSVIH